MSIANDNPELTHSPGEIGDELIIPLKSLTKAEIENQTRNWLKDKLQVYEPPEMYVFLKQMEESVKRAIEITKEDAFNAVGTRFRGEQSGLVLGHGVKLSWPEVWRYSPAVQQLKAQQEADMEVLKATERATGKAFKEPTTGRITVTLNNH